MERNNTKFIPCMGHQVALQPFSYCFGFLDNFTFHPQEGAVVKLD